MEQKKEDIFDRLMHLPGLRIFEKFYKKNKEMLLYLLFGGLTTIVSIGTYAWFNVGMHINELIANIISWIFAVTFDESFAKATGTKADAYNMIIAVLTAITIVVGMRIMGTMLISSLIIFPALISMRNFKTFKSVIICSAIVSVVCFLLGIILSYLYSIPTGASIVLVNTVALILSYLIGELRH